MDTRIALFAAVALAGSLALAGPVAAAPLTVTSYSMPNGDGQASGGSYNYWDVAYTGAGSTTTDGAALSGGVGDLTDGVVATDFWYNTENGAGTGPYVGWYRPATPDPTITFNFAGPVTINGIRVHIDNSNVGGVIAPSKIFIDGADTAFAAPANGTIGFVDFTGLNLTGSSHTLQFQQNGGSWTFVSEITFDGNAAGVPEPTAWSLMIAGFGLAGTALRRRRTALV